MPRCPADEGKDTKLLFACRYQKIDDVPSLTQSLFLAPALPIFLENTFMHKQINKLGECILYFTYARTVASKCELHLQCCLMAPAIGRDRDSNRDSNRDRERDSDREVLGCVHVAAAFRNVLAFLEGICSYDSCIFMSQCFLLSFCVFVCVRCSMCAAHPLPASTD